MQPRRIYAQHLLSNLAMGVIESRLAPPTITARNLITAQTRVRDLPELITFTARRMKGKGVIPSAPPRLATSPGLSMSPCPAAQYCRGPAPVNSEGGDKLGLPGQRWDVSPSAAAYFTLPRVGHSPRRPGNTEKPQTQTSLWAKPSRLQKSLHPICSSLKEDIRVSDSFGVIE